MFELDEIDWRVLGMSLVVSAVTFGAMAWFNRDRSAEIRVEAVTIPQLSPTDYELPVSEELDTDAYRQRFVELVAGASATAVAGLDTLDSDFWLLLSPQEPAARDLVAALDALSVAYNDAQEIVPPAAMASLHQDLLAALATLNDANIRLTGSFDAGSSELTLAGYGLLESGYNQLVAVYARFEAEF